MSLLNGPCPSKLWILFVKSARYVRYGVCCMLYAVCCMLYDVCSMLCAVCCVLYDVCCMLCAVCCMPCAVCCVLYAVYCMMCAVCCMLYDLCSMLCAVCCMLCAVWCVLCAVCCVLCDVCCMMCAVCCMPCAVCCVLYAVCCMLCAVCCMLYDLCCMLCAVCSLQTVQTTPQHLAPVPNFVFLCVEFIYFVVMNCLVTMRWTYCVSSCGQFCRNVASSRPAMCCTYCPVTERFPLHNDLLCLRFAPNFSLRLTSNVPVGAQQFPAQTAVTQLGLE